MAGLHFFVDQRHSMDEYLPSLKIADGSLVPLFYLIGAAFCWVVKRIFSIQRWHGPADSIFGAHRLDNEIDVKSDIGSTLATFISLSGGASVGQYGPLVHLGQLLALIFAPSLVINQLAQTCLLMWVGCNCRWVPRANCDFAQRPSCDIFPSGR